MALEGRVHSSVFIERFKEVNSLEAVLQTQGYTLAQDREEPIDFQGISNDQERLANSMKTTCISDPASSSSTYSGQESYEPTSVSGVSLGNGNKIRDQPSNNNIVHKPSRGTTKSNDNIAKEGQHNLQSGDESRNLHELNRTGAGLCTESHDVVMAETLAIEADEVLSNHAEVCDQLLAVTTDQLEKVKEFTIQIGDLKASLIKARKAIAVELDEIFRDIEYKLQERKMELFTQLTNFSYNKECHFDDQSQDLENTTFELTQLVDQLKNLQETISDQNHVPLNCNRLKELDEKLHEETVKLSNFSISENADLKFHRTGLLEVRKSIQNMASITSSQVIPSKSKASGDGLKKCQVQQQTIVKVTPCNSSGSIEKEKAQLYNQEVNVECQCIENSNSTYSILYIAPEQGSYCLDIKLFDQHIKDSPFRIKTTPGPKVFAASKSANLYQLTRVHHMKASKAEISKISSNVSSPRSYGSESSINSLKILPHSTTGHTITEPPWGDYLAKIGVYGRKKGEFTNPQGVCVDTNDRVYCTDSSNQNIQVFTDKGTYIETIERRGRTVGQFLRPIGICFSKDGCMLFNDYENKCVNAFKDGQFIRRIGYGKLIGPKGIAFTPRGTILVADSKANQVIEFSMKGSLIKRIPANKTDKLAQLSGPHYIALNKHGDIYITDFHSHSVKVFNREGEFLKALGSHGTGNGQFNAPTGIAIDSSGNILVADWGNSRIQIFDEEGSFLALVDTSSAPLFGPQCVYAMRENHVIVADSGNHCVKVFQYEV